MIWFNCASTPFRESIDPPPGGSAFSWIFTCLNLHLSAPSQIASASMYLLSTRKTFWSGQYPMADSCWGIKVFWPSVRKLMGCFSYRGSHGMSWVPLGLQWLLPLLSLASSLPFNSCWLPRTSLINNSATSESESASQRARSMCHTHTHSTCRQSEALILFFLNPTYAAIQSKFIPEGSLCQYVIYLIFIYNYYMFIYNLNYKYIILLNIHQK